MKFEVAAENCTGCRLCQQICAISHFGEQNLKKIAIGITAEFPSPGRYTPRVCTQCGVCEEVCPVGAVEEKEGVFVIDEEECTMCDICVDECPENVMFLHDDVEKPIKCDNCWECVSVCNTGAITCTE